MYANQKENSYNTDLYSAYKSLMMRKSFNEWINNYCFDKYNYNFDKFIVDFI